MARRLTLAALSASSGLPARTIRFYIARGLLAGPAKSGREAVYTPDHLARLRQIQKLQSAGRTLSEIERLLAGGSRKRATPAPETWFRHVIAADVMVWVKAGAAPWRARQVQDAIGEFARRAAAADNETNATEREEETTHE